MPANAMLSLSGCRPFAMNRTHWSTRSKMCLEKLAHTHELKGTENLDVERNVASLRDTGQPIIFKTIW